MREGVLRRRVDPDVGKRFPFRMTNVSQSFGGYMVVPHWHDHLEFIKVTTGRVAVALDHDTFEAETNDIIYIGSGQLHGVKSISSKPAEIKGMIFENSFITNLREHFATRQIYRLFTRKNSQLEHLFTPEHPLWNDLNDCIELSDLENKRRDICYEMAIKSCIYRMLTSLIRFYNRSENETMLRLAADAPLLDPVLNHIEKHLAETIHLDELCRLANMSRYHFSRFFKKTTGMTIPRYITMLRIELAKKMLGEQELSITEIAESTGFCNVHYFGKVFKSITGVSPLQYRNEAAIESRTRSSGNMR